MLDRLMSQHPELPAAYIVIHQPWRGKPSTVGLQLSTPTAFEQWRVTLGIHSDAVELEPNGHGSWIQAAGVHDGLHVEISAHGILLTDDMLNAPRDREDVAA
jgi:hypothetical protein